MEIEKLKTYRKDILTIAERYHAPNIRVFGVTAHRNKRV